MKAQTRQAHVLDTTETLLLQAGIGALTMRKVAAAAGISLGNLQYHFPTREDLLLALLLRFLEPYEARLETRPQLSGRTVAEALQPLFLEALRHPNFDACAKIYKEIWAAANHAPKMQEGLTAYYVRLTAFYRAILASVAPDGTPDAQLDRAAAAVLPLIEGYCITKDAMRPPLDALAEDWARMAAALLPEGPPVGTGPEKAPEAPQKPQGANARTRKPLVRLKGLSNG